MIARVAEHEDIPADADEEYVARFRSLIASQPGFRGGYHLIEPESGRALSVTLWDDGESLAAFGRALAAPEAPADGRISGRGRTTARVFEVAAVLSAGDGDPPGA